MENIELMDNLMMIIALIISILVFYIIILLFKMYFNTQKNKVDKINRCGATITTFTVISNLRDSRDEDNLNNTFY